MTLKFAHFERASWSEIWMRALARLGHRCSPPRRMVPRAVAFWHLSEGYGFLLLACTPRVSKDESTCPARAPFDAAKNALRAARRGIG